MTNYQLLVTAFTLHKKVYIYHPDIPLECLDHPTTVSGDPVLSEFVLDLSKLW